MLPIYVCEDELSIRQRISSHIASFYSFHQEYALPQIVSFSEPHGLLNAVSNNPEMAIYFLDIELNCDMNGLELAKKIRVYDPKGFIIFITSHGEYAPKTFKLRIEAFDYVNKASTQLTSTISNSLSIIHERNTVFQENNISNPRLQFRLDRQVRYYFANELIALMTTKQSHRVQVITTKGTSDLTGSLAKIAETLPADYFIKCHRSCIANKNHILRYIPETHMIELSNHQMHSVSREYRHLFV